MKTDKTVETKEAEIKEIAEDLKNDIQKLAKGTGISFLGSIVGRGLLFFTQVAIVRLFGPEVFGLYILGLALVKFVEVASRFGLDTGSMKFVSIYHRDDPARTRGTILSAVGMSFLIGMVMGVFLYLSANFFAEVLFHKAEIKNIIRTFAFCIPFVSSSFVAASATQGFHTTKYAAYIKDIIQPTTNFLLVLVFSFTSLKLMGVVYAFIISYFLTFILSLFFLRKIYLDSTTKKIRAIFEVKDLLRYSTPLVFHSFLMYLFIWTDILMLGYFSTSIEIGIYRAASLVPMLISLMPMACDSIYAPVIADLFNKGKIERFAKALKTATRWGFLITLPALIIIVFSSDIIMAIFGSEFIKKGSPILITLAIAEFVGYAAGGVGTTLVMTGRQKLELLNSIVMVIINIMLNYFFIPKFGGLGAAIATGISFLTMELLRLFEVYFIYRVHPYNKGFVPVLSSGAISIAILYLLNHINILSDYFLFPLGILATITTFLIIFYLSTKTEEDRYILYTMKAKFSGLYGKKV